MQILNSGVKIPCFVHDLYTPQQNLHDYYWSTFMSKEIEAVTQGPTPATNLFGKHFAPAAHWQTVGTLPDQNNPEAFWA